MKGASWWNEEVKEKVKRKKEVYDAFISSETHEEKEISRIRYKAAKKVAKKDIAVAMSKAYDRLHQKMKTKEGEKEVLNWRGLGKEEQGIWV